MLSVTPIARGSKVGSLPDLLTLTSLNPLHGHYSVINVSCVLRLFAQEQQLHLVRALAGLSFSEPGPLICGTQFSQKEKGNVTTFFGSSKPILFCHSPESWRELWDGVVFEKGEVEVKVNTRSFLVAGQTMDNMVWSVRRL
ncbi:hypothetical protein F5141DRAFT_1106970 [Pisolithus sp. B1]|nr:hypothetical protein F5141DRAFT_1106970 [Pisolithus sp. B1]